MNIEPKPWEGQSEQIPGVQLPAGVLEVNRMKGKDCAGPMLMLTARQDLQETYRWQKGTGKSIGGEAPIYLWSDRAALTNAVSYLVAGEDLHEGDVYRCVHYRGSVPIAQELYQITWEDEQQLRPRLKQELERAEKKIDGLKDQLDEARIQLERLKEIVEKSGQGNAEEIQKIFRENIRLNTRLEAALGEIEELKRTAQKEKKRLDNARQWAAAWENKARKAEQQLAEQE